MATQRKMTSRKNKTADRNRKRREQQRLKRAREAREAAEASARTAGTEEAATSAELSHAPASTALEREAVSSSASTIAAATAAAAATTRNVADNDSSPLFRDEVIDLRESPLGPGIGAGLNDGQQQQEEAEGTSQPLVQQSVLQLVLAQYPDHGDEEALPPEGNATTYAGRGSLAGSVKMAEEGNRRRAFGSPCRTIDGQTILHPTPSMDQRSTKRNATNNISRRANESPLKFPSEMTNGSNLKSPPKIRNSSGEGSLPSFVPVASSASSLARKQPEQSPIHIHKPPSSEKLLRDRIGITPSPGKEMSGEEIAGAMKEMFFNLSESTQK